MYCAWVPSSCARWTRTQLLRLRRRIVEGSSPVLLAWAPLALCLPRAWCATAASDPAQGGRPLHPRARDSVGAYNTAAHGCSSLLRRLRGHRSLPTWLPPAQSVGRAALLPCHDKLRALLLRQLHQILGASAPSPTVPCPCCRQPVTMLHPVPEDVARHGPLSATDLGAFHRAPRSVRAFNQANAYSRRSVCQCEIRRCYSQNLDEV